MHIASSESLFLNVEQHRFVGREVRETLDMRKGGQSLQFSRHERSEVEFSHAAQARLTEDQRVLSEAQLEQLTPQAAGMPAGESMEFDFSLSAESLYKLRMLLAALGRLNGEADASLRRIFDGPVVPGPYQPAGAAASSPVSGADSLNYRYSVTEWRGEAMSVTVGGQITTLDGRQIEFGLNVDMRSVQYSHASVSLRAGAALKDPLVLNLGGGPVRLTGGRSEFDLDADGRTESMANLANGSAFLALDRNGNGRIDDGRELFGALSGDGFADLAAYDEDGNGFIDEGDGVFAELRLWHPDSQELVDLSSAGVGAIGLARAHGNFDLLVGSQMEGRVRSTGLFLFENGQAGSVQQIDLAV